MAPAIIIRQLPESQSYTIAMQKGVTYRRNQQQPKHYDKDPDAEERVHVSTTDSEVDQNTRQRIQPCQSQRERKDNHPDMVNKEQTILINKLR